MPDDHKRVERLRENRRTDISMAHRMKRYVEALQVHICKAVETEDGGARFRDDPWDRAGGGGGLTRVLEGGAVFEKGGVNTSFVFGELPDRVATALDVQERSFHATGISLVLHPRSPYVPTVHANFRYFALGENLVHPADEWFGGGADLTPYYPFKEDAQHFHRIWAEVCGKHSLVDYHTLKAACDEYFFLPHRNETRGIGGIFYDYLRGEPEDAFHFTREAGRAFLNSYLPIVRRNKSRAWGDREEEFQQIRRGRYAEFNLLFDRGTRFGIETQGRTESILMSLPPRVQWRYDWQPEAGSVEAEAGWFFTPRDWVPLPAE